MLRSRLYIGMLPVAGLLIAICLYSVYSYSILVNQLEELQTKHYAAISQIDQLLLATSQAERAIRLRYSGDNDLADRVHNRSQDVIKAWLDERPSIPKESLDPPEEALTLLLINLENVTRNIFTSRPTIPDEDIGILLERIEEVAIRSIASHNDIIIGINARFQRQSRAHFYIVLGGIIASLFLMGGVAYFLSQRILKPIDALASSANKLADNDWETDYKPTSKDEIANLETAFFEMSQRIKEFKRDTGKQIARTRQRMEECLNNLPHPVLFINANRSIVYQNPIAEQITKKLEWHKSIPKSLSSRVETVFGTGEEMLPTDFEETVSFKIENAQHHFLPIVVRIDREDVKDIECALILQDVTNLRLSDELKSDLVATVSHEIKTPVTSATMALHLLQEENLGQLNVDQKEMIDTAVSDLSRLRRLLDHMLQIARLEKHIPKLNTLPISPSHIVQTAMETHAQVAERKKLDLNAQTVANLPDVLVDPNMIVVALSNFISNAIKYGGTGSHITIYSDANRDGFVRFGVLDEGPGIPEEDADRIFDKFYRSSRTRSAEGVGLGLSICKDIVAAHGGEIGCSNRSNGGSDFHFFLPVQDSKTSKS